MESYVLVSSTVAYLSEKNPYSLCRGKVLCLSASPCRRGYLQHITQQNTTIVGEGTIASNVLAAAPLVHYRLWQPQPPLLTYQDDCILDRLTLSGVYATQGWPYIQGESRGDQPLGAYHMETLWNLWNISNISHRHPPCWGNSILKQE